MSPKGGAAELTGIEWTNETPCQSCGDTVYTRVSFVISGSTHLTLCPFCLGLAIDRATGWKVYGQMAAWENTRKIHAALKAGHPNPFEQRNITPGDPTP